MAKKAGIAQTVLQVNWIHNADVERWLRRMLIGRTLNVCCGTSLVGDVRVDIDPNTSRTEPGDLFNLIFPRLSFDTVICDPPYSYYGRMRWVNKLADLARKRLLISPDRTIIRLPRENWKTSLYGFQCTQSSMYLRLYYCFDRKNNILQEAR